MTGRRWLIMLILAALTVVFSVQAARTWLRPLQDQVAVQTDDTSRKTPAPPTLKQRKPPKNAYEGIAVRSLFDQSRTEGIVETPVGDLKRAETSRYAKRIGLFGVVIEDGEKMALVNKDIVRRGRGDLMWVRIGDLIERVKVVGIERDRIFLQENDSRYEILLTDQRYPDRRAKAEAATGPTVISTEVEASQEPTSATKTPTIRVKPKTENQNSDQ